MFELMTRSSGNDIADDLAKTGVSESYAGLEPYCGILAVIIVLFQ